MPDAKHTHKLKRISYKSGNSVYFCILPDCNFKTKTLLALGKRTICWRCGEEFFMTEYSIRLAKPHCSKCHKSKTEIEGEPIPPEHIASLSERLQNALETAKQQTTEEEDI